MNYNSNRKKLKLPEYGRNIHKMVDYMVAIKDREERNRAANQIIEIMGNMHPYLRDVNDFKHKLWDHIAIMSDFKADIDYPCDPPKPETFAKKPKPMPYDRTRIKYRHYGKLMEKMLKKASDFENNKPEQNTLVELLANHMKKSLLLWNKDSVDDSRIFKDIEGLSSGAISPDKTIQLTETKDLLKNGKKKGRGGQHGHGRKNK